MPGHHEQEAAGPATSSHMMKTTKRGRPHLKDTMDLFATLIVSLKLTTHTQYFRRYPNSFNCDEAAANLASLKFAQSNRGPDPRDPSRIVTTTTTTTFSMTRDMAKAMCQHFMDARLIENASEPQSNLFKERGTYMLTPKGLHVLERFISKNGMNADHLADVFASQPICMKLLHLERRSLDDEIIVAQSVIFTLFRRFAGAKANWRPNNFDSLDSHVQYHERSRGIHFVDERPSGHAPRPAAAPNRYCFQAVAALEWLCDFTSVVGREEAAEMGAQFVRFGLIALVSDKRKNNDSAIIFTVRGPAPGGNSPVQQQGEFRCTTKAVYRFTEEGLRVARWDSPATPNGSATNLSSIRSSDDGRAESTTTLTESEKAGAKIHRRMSMAERLNSTYDGDRKGKESNTDRLKYILAEAGLRAMFRDFLKQNFCEENLSFWLDVQDFKRKFGVTSSAVAASPTPLGPGMPAGGKSKNSPGQQAMERHHEVLIHQAYQIYSRYLAPGSQQELNIDHALRNELVGYLSDVMQGLTGKPFSGRVEEDQMSAFNATQLQTMIRLYERIQTHVFRLMATDSVPKFIKTPTFQAVRRDHAGEFDRIDEEEGTRPAHPPGLEGEEVGGTYVTISQAASEREERERRTMREGRPDTSPVSS